MPFQFISTWTVETLALWQRPSNTAVCCVQKQRLIFSLQWFAQLLIICSLQIGPFNPSYEKIFRHFRNVKYKGEWLLACNGLRKAKGIRCYPERDWTTWRSSPEIKIPGQPVTDCERVKNTVHFCEKCKASIHQVLLTGSYFLHIMFLG